MPQEIDKYVLFGHHFAAIAAAGPLLGPVLAAQFGYLPGMLWILIGCVLADGVHDMGVYMHNIRPGDIKGGSLIGVVLLAISFLAGPHVAENSTLAAMLTFSKKERAVIIPVYGFFALVLPVWFLLIPRDYLST